VELCPRAPKDKFVEEYFDVLQNIEFMLVQVYREREGVTDWDVQAALEALIRIYKAQQRGKTFVPSHLSPAAEDMVERVRAILERRSTYPGDIRRLSPDEIVRCLKRVLSSVKFWTKERGRTGYLDFVKECLP